MVHTIHTCIPDPHVYTVHSHGRHLCIDLYQCIPVYTTRQGTYIDMDRFLPVCSCIHSCNNKQIFYDHHEVVQIDGYDASTLARWYTTDQTLLYLSLYLWLPNQRPIQILQLPMQPYA
jgi:hypothetical protein